MSEDLVLSLEDAINRMKNADKSDLYVRMKDLGNGKFEIPFMTIPVNVGSQSQGVIHEKKAIKGELLVEGSVAIAATTVVYSTWFQTKGYKNLFVVITNPVAWSTNPTGITLGQQFTNDDGTTAWILMVGGSALTIALNRDDATLQCLFLYQASAANTIMQGTYPNLDSDMKVRLVFTPAGSAESQSMGYKVYGVG